jgi:acetyl-CoA C-acetyltransferase
VLPALFGNDPGWDRAACRFPEIARPGPGLHTIATSPQLADAASAVVVGNHRAATILGRDPIAQIVGTAQTTVRSPLLTGAVTAARLAVKRAGLRAADVDVVEANESFAVTPLLLTGELDLDPDRVNPTGGALAVGHPLGATDGILIAQALDTLARIDGEHALITIPAALGLGAALVLRRLG